MARAFVEYPPPHCGNDCDECCGENTRSNPLQPLSQGGRYQTSQVGHASSSPHSVYPHRGQSNVRDERRASCYSAQEERYSRMSWNRYSANFALGAFCELRVESILGSSQNPI